MTTGRLAKGWDGVLAMLPPDAPEIQRREMRRAFYMGAATMMDVQFQIATEAISEDDAADVLDGLMYEIKEFFVQVNNGKA